MPDKLPRLGEFDRIARFFRPLAAGEPGARALLDDAASLAVPPGEELVLTVDAVIENIHFLPEDPPADIARKALRVNLSDLAAKGAQPRGYLLTLCLPDRRDDAWLAAFCDGLAADQQHYGITLLGGDSVRTEGPTAISITALGLVPKGRMVARGGAMPGDDVYVTGTIGDAGLGLRLLQGLLPPLDPPHAAELTERYRLPRPRTAIAQAIRQNAHAALDISDGLLADLGHIAEVSEVDITLDAAAFPLSEAAGAAVAAASFSVVELTTFGDDYEIALTAPVEARHRLGEAAERCGLRLNRIGRVSTPAGVSGRVTVLDGDGAAIAMDGPLGFEH